MGKRVAVVEYMHETNTFSVLLTDMAEFEAGHYFVGDEIEKHFLNTNSEIGGFLQAVDEFSWEPVFTVAATAEPSGIVSEAARQEITNEAISQLYNNGPYDGVYIAFHGAMVTETSQDGETQFLQEIRKVVGDEIPVAVSLDLHANIFDEMAQYADIVVSYRTYPHVDMAETGKKACDLLESAMNGDIRPAIAIARPPMLVGCDSGRTTNDGPMCHLLTSAENEANRDGILGISINAGFPDADVEAAGPSVIVCYDQLTANKNLQDTVARKICNGIWKWRDTFDKQTSLSECLELIKTGTADKGPIVIADYSDNPGSGSYSDSTAIIAALINLDIKNAAAGALWDPEAVEELINHQEGATVSVVIGGKVDPSIGGGPLKVTGTVSTIGDGNFVFEGPMYRGLPGRLGQCVCLKIGGLEILIVSERMQLLDKNMFRAVGIEPAEKSILVVKSMQHFRAAFAPIAVKIIETDAGGLCSPDVTTRHYKYVRRPVFPLDQDSDCLSKEAY